MKDGRRDRTPFLNFYPNQMCRRYSSIEERNRKRCFEKRSIDVNGKHNFEQFMSNMFSYIKENFEHFSLSNKQQI